MDNFTKVMASIGSAVVPIGAAYLAVGTELHERLVGAQNTHWYQSLEASLANATGVTDPERVTNIGTVVAAVGLLYFAYEIAKPVTRGFASFYGARLE